MPNPAEPPPSGSRPGARPGGSQVPEKGDLASERRRYERHGGDHVARYRWAAERIRGGRVLDVGCGHGFGALLLKGSFREYLGVDVDEPAIEWANRIVAPAAPGARFATPAGRPAGLFDAVTCFEVLEHVDDPAALLRELRAAVVPGGSVFLSTPNGSLSAGRPEWFMSPFHVAEFTASEFVGLVSAAFPGAGEFYRQRRVDWLDCAPQAVRRQLADGPRTSTTRAAPTAASTALRTGHALFRKVPSPASLWQLRPLPTPPRDGLGYSHLLWAGTSAGGRSP
ncbi:MAG TPA: class I SAM-dependent methyltransferase [Thermoplasmata archaeon]|nr:class I SAM-dependent methyltransferase [Thermoplasmata archaeon]